MVSSIFESKNLFYDYCYFSNDSRHKYVDCRVDVKKMKNIRRQISKIFEHFILFIGYIILFTFENIGHMAKYCKLVMALKEDGQKMKFVQRIIWRRKENPKKIRLERNILGFGIRRSIKRIQREIEVGFTLLGGACSRWHMSSGGDTPRKDGWINSICVSIKCLLISNLSLDLVIVCFHVSFWSCTQVCSVMIWFRIDIMNSYGINALNNMSYWCTCISVGVFGKLNISNKEKVKLTF